MKLFPRFGLSISALLIGVIVGIGTMSLISEKRVLEAEMKKHQTEITLRLAKVCEESLYQDELVVFNYLKVLENERGFSAAYFLDKNENIRVHSDPNLIGTKAKPINTQTHRLVKAPVFYGSSQVGEACLVLNQRELENFLRMSLQTSFNRLLPIGIIGLISGLLGAFILAKTMIIPIQRIVEQMKDVGHGRRDIFPDPKREDELGWMASELNKMIVKLKELDQLKNEFVSAVTHELRSPLTAIERFVSLMLKGTYGPINSDQQETLVTIKNNSIRLTQFVDDVLTTSKLESRHVDAYLETFDVRSVMEDVRKLYSPIAEEKKLKLEIKTPRTETRAWADRNMLHHILSNLVSNALKFTEKGSVVIEAQELPKEVEFRVSDTGPGIPESDRDKIFEKFYRSLPAAHKSKGTGLGLFIVKSFLEVQNGTIRLAPPAPTGTTIIFTLPNRKT